MRDILAPGEKSALAAWARRVRLNREQAERFRETADDGDFYAPTAAAFKVDPFRKDEPVLDILRSLARPGENWLDIGAGGGRYALPLALTAREIVAVEPSGAMLSMLRAGMIEHNISNIRVVQERWPLTVSLVEDVALISHVGYDIEEIGEFLESMEKSARRLCVAVLLDRAPTALTETFWPRIHGEKRIPLPALREFLVLQTARGRLCEVRISPRGGEHRHNPDLALSFLRQQLFIQPGGEKDRLLHDLFQRVSRERPAALDLGPERSALGIVSWEPCAR